MPTRSSPTRRSIRRNILGGLTIVLVLAGAVGGWAGTVQLAGALIASGSVVVDTNVKKVQHPVGGVVGDLRVHDGDQVKAGDILLSLDQTVTRANLAIVTKGLDQLMARKARLAAERDGADAIVFPEELRSRENDADVAEITAGERKLFDLRRSARSGQKAQLHQQSEQLLEEIRGLGAQQKAKVQEIDLINRELQGVRELFKNNLVQLSRLTQLEREAARLNGEQAQLVATIAQANRRIAEIELKVIQVDQDLSSEVAKEMRETEGKIGEFVERKVAAEDQLQRVDIRAPQDGSVFQLSVHTIGGVIAAGETIMLIVPEAEIRAAFHRLQSGDHARDQRLCQPDLRRHQLGPAHGGELLHHPHLHAAGGAGQAGRDQAGAGNARGMLRGDRRTDGDLLSAQTAARPVDADVSRQRVSPAATGGR
jgi:HlyD family secretion protein